MKRIASIIALSALLNGAAIAQNDEEVEIETFDLGAGIYAIYGRGGNIGLSVGDDAVLMIDDQFAPMAEPLTAAIGELSDAPVDLILNTHWHGDHTGGNEAFSGDGAFVIAHENVRVRMISGLEYPSPGTPVPPAAADALPDMTLSDGGAFHINGQTIQLIHVPGAHTDGDTIVHFKEANVLHMGDVYFNGRFPFIDFFSGGTIDGTIAGLEMGLSLADEETQIIPGHGALATKADMQASRDVLAEARALVQAAIDEGLTLNETVERDPLGELAESLGETYVRTKPFMTMMTYASLTGGFN